ncbi:MAG: acylphosphatase [Candidatus Anstonellaceae archaeon]
MDKYDKSISALKILVYGKVQGVFFRAWAKKQALKFFLVGWAKNLIDGSVEIFIEGKEENLEKFLFSCLKGSSNSEVKYLIIQPTDKKNLTNFDIL